MLLEHAEGTQQLQALQDFTRRLREEQETAYQQSLKEDQERERQRSEQRAQQEAAERAAMEEAARTKCASPHNLKTAGYQASHSLHYFPARCCTEMVARSDALLLRVPMSAGQHRTQRRRRLLTGQPCWHRGDCPTVPLLRQSLQQGAQAARPSVCGCPMDLHTCAISSQQPLCRFAPKTGWTFCNLLELSILSATDATT